MLTWSIMARACRSASKRAMTWRLSMPGLMTLRATLRWTGWVCSAMQTVPMPPSPICCSSLYGPMTVPGPFGFRARDAPVTLRRTAERPTPSDQADSALCRVPAALRGLERREIKPQFMIEAMHRATEGDAIITSDVGQHQMWAAQYYGFDKPRRWINSGGLGTMGFGLPAAVGAKVALPRRAGRLPRRRRQPDHERARSWRPASPKTSRSRSS